MAKDPAFLFYSQDFFTGTAMLSFEDRGKYITILCLMHQQGRLSEESISFIVGLVSFPLKSKFLIDENGLWYNQRLENETEKRVKFSESRRLNGMKGGRGNKKEEIIPKASAKATANLMEDEDVNENIDNNLLFFKSLMSENSKWIFTMSEKFKKPPDEIKSMLNEFMLHLKSPVVTHETIEKFESHFSNWTRIQIKKNGTAINNTKRPYVFDVDRILSTTVGSNGGGLS